jgi:DNA-binding NarL/FixJ family response regulator
VRLLLESERRFEVVGESGDGLEGVALIERAQPEVVVASLVLPALGGIEVAARARRRWPRVHVIVLTASMKEESVLRALRAGAFAYVLRQADPSELIKAIDESLEGRRYISPPFSDVAIAAYLASSPKLPSGPLDSLTTREREALLLAAEGLTNAAIAARLGISPRTAEKHRFRAMHKLCISNQTALVRFAIDNDLLPHPEQRAPLA